MEACLGPSEKDIKDMFVDVQTLKDEDYYQAEDMYKTYYNFIFLCCSATHKLCFTGYFYFTKSGLL